MRRPRPPSPPETAPPLGAPATADADSVDTLRLFAFSDALLAIYNAAESASPGCAVAVAFSRALEGAQVRFVSSTARGHEVTEPDSDRYATFACSFAGQAHRLAFLRERPFDEIERFMMRALARHLSAASQPAGPGKSGGSVAPPEGRVGLSRQGLREMGLTPTEGAIMEGVVRGESNGEIASRLGRSRRTIEKHMENILEKLGVETRLAAARAVLRWLGSRVPGTPQ